jgi:16S rRNA (uracil1498-N3)-methyltransferase
VKRALADLRLDELGMGALKLGRVQDGARDPVRLLGSSRTFAEERRLVLGSGIDAVVASWSGGRKDEIGDASGMVDDQVLRDQTSHRGTEHRGRGDTGGVEHHDRIECHRRHRRVGAALRFADSAGVEGDHPVIARKVGNDRIERRAARAEAGDEQERVAVSADHDRKADAVGCSRGETHLGHGTTIAGGGCRTMHAAVPRFFVEPTQVAGGRATLTGTDANHLSRALRALVGETIVIVEDGRIEHGVELDVVTPVRVSGAIVWSRPVDGEPRLAVHVLQAVPAQAMDATVEALTEAGAATIRPVLTHRTVSRPDPSRVIHRLERWRLIAREAAQLAGRAAPPDVHAILPLGEALAALPAGARILACVIRQEAAPILSAVPAPPADIGLVIGPEGGLDATDLRALGDAGAVTVHLGSRTLPSRLAGAVATSLLLAGAGDLDTPAVPPPA